MVHPELEPLEGGEFHLEVRCQRLHRPPPLPTARQSSVYGQRSCVKGPLRAFRLLLLVTIVPVLFICIPVYMSSTTSGEELTINFARYRVFSGQLYPVGMTDMRMIDNKISTTWCQRQVVRSNATFNAFLVSEQPIISHDLVPVSMTRYLTLQDDMKEYWGFYLLEGSVVTVSTCVRWPGASLTMIRGHKHLQECAYIGDDSSEELEELLEANEKGLLKDDVLLEKIRTMLNDDSPANDPDTMKRHKGGVRFHDLENAAHEPNTLLTHDEPAPDEESDITDHDPQELRQILERLHAKRRAGGMQETKDTKEDEEDVNYVPPAHLMSLPALHRHRDTNVDREERRWLIFNDLDGNATFQESNTGTLSEVDDISNQPIITDKVDNRVGANDTANADYKKAENRTEAYIQGVSAFTEETSTLSAVEAKERTPLTSVEEEETALTSAEVYEEVLSRLKRLGERGQRVLERLANKSRNATFTKPDDRELRTTTIKSESKDELSEAKAEIKLKELRKILVEAIDEEMRKDEQRRKRRAANEQARVKRELLIKQAFQKTLNDDDEERNLALEEDLEPDGYAEDHQVVNETTANDMSNSEFWSSFSSSEEALLECEGLILNLPLTPHPMCVKGGSNEALGKAALHNAITYTVPANGYYFFVFNSENEVQDNFIRVRFDLQKTVYDVRRALLECRNYTERCEIPLHFFSAEKVVLEVPYRDNDSLWNEEFVVMSECVPRTSIYLACVVAVPFLVVVFAFQ